MLKLNNMLIIGAAGRNVGKTELACKLIDKYRQSNKVTGIKVTTVHKRDGKCPRGGEGCGVCSSLKEDYCITEETDLSLGKDTSRLLAAGANKVFWLRVMKSHLTEGVTALLNNIDAHDVLICESNSLRQVVQPGLFLLVKNKDSEQYKASATTVKDYADRIIHFDSNNYEHDIDINKITFKDNIWKLN